MEQSLDERIEAIEKSIKDDSEYLQYAEGQAHYNVLREINENYAKLYKLKQERADLKPS